MFRFRERKTVMKNFRLTHEEWERFQRIPGHFGTTWSFADVVLMALNEAYTRAERNGCLRPIRVNGAELRIPELDFTRSVPAMDIPATPKITKRELEPTPEAPPTSPAQAKRKTKPAATRKKPTIVATPARSARNGKTKAKKGGKR